MLNATNATKQGPGSDITHGQALDMSQSSSARVVFSGRILLLAPT